MTADEPAFIDDYRTSNLDWKEAAEAYQRASEERRSYKRGIWDIAYSMAVFGVGCMLVTLVLLATYMVIQIIEGKM